MLSLTMAACSWSTVPFLYKPNVEQGNVLSPNQLASIKIGMSRDEVTYLLGNPVLTTVIDTQETQYVYTFQVHKQPVKEQKAVLTFSGDRLVNIA